MAWINTLGNDHVRGYHYIRQDESRMQEQIQFITIIFDDFRWCLMVLMVFEKTPTQGTLPRHVDGLTHHQVGSERR